MVMVVVVCIYYKLPRELHKWDHIDATYNVTLTIGSDSTQQWSLSVKRESKETTEQDFFHILKTINVSTYKWGSNGCNTTRNIVTRYAAWGWKDEAKSPVSYDRDNAEKREDSVPQDLANMYTYCFADGKGRKNEPYLPWRLLEGICEILKTLPGSCWNLLGIGYFCTLFPGKMR